MLPALSMSRLLALCRKETRQITRDPSSMLICFVIPLLLLIIFGYGINLDSAALRIGLIMEDQSPQARNLAATFKASPFIDARVYTSRQPAIKKMQEGELRGIIIIPTDFSRKLEAFASSGEKAGIQLLTDGSEPNTANFVQAYATGAWKIWLQNEMQDKATGMPQLIEEETRFWYNQAAISRNYLLPGAVSIIITVVGAILTSLVIAREWERGTMEALLSTRVTRLELMLSKLIPYYLMGLLALALCMFFSVVVFSVPFNGSWLLLWLVSSLFLANTLGMGLLISTLTRNQFNAAQVALNVAFLPAIMLSGFVFEIDSMPALVKAATYIIPARYYVSLMHTLFLAGNIPVILLVNSAFLFVTGGLLLTLTFLKTRLRLE